MRLSDISIRRPVMVSMMCLLLVLFGVVGLLRLPVRELPDIDPPIVNVQTVYPGASAGVIETQVTEPLEDTLSSVEGIKKMTSESREQVSSITIEFDLSENIDDAAQDVRDRVARVRGRLPDDIDEPIVAKQDADARPSIWVALYSNRFATLELTTIAEKLFQDRLQTVPGVSSVILGGSKRFAIRIRLDSEKMAARRVTVLDVERALREQSVEIPSGRIEGLEREYSIETRGQLKSPEEYNRLVIDRRGDDLIRLRDVGFAEVGVEDERSAARYNGQPALGLGIVKQSKANIIDVASGIKEEVQNIFPQIPEGIEYFLAYDESVYVEKSIKEVWITLGLAFLLVVFVIFIFLGNIRATFVPSITIPVSIVGTFAVLYFFGYSINIITMLALVLAIGLVVDDAIVVLENIHRHIEKGMDPMQASFHSMREIGFAVIATTVALVAVFLPLTFQTSDTGRLFIEFAIAISFSVIISTFVALTLAPTICARILKKEEKGNKRGFIKVFDHWIVGQRKLYLRGLRWTLKHIWVMFLICFVVAGASVYFYNHLQSEFLPEEDKGRLFTLAIAPQGSTSEYTDRMVRKMEAIIADTPEVEGFFSAVALSRGGPGQAEQGLSFIRLKEDRKRHIRDIVNGPGGLRDQFFGTIEGALVIPILPKAIGGGFSQPYQLVLQHQDLNELNRIAEDFSNQLRQAGFLINVRSTFDLNKPELRVNVNRDRAAVLGVSVKDISRVLQILFGGLDVTRLNIGGKEYDVIVQLERVSRLVLSDLEKIYVRNNDGRLIQLTNLIDYETSGGPSAINHFNRLRSATIEATLKDIPMGEALERTEQLLAEQSYAGMSYAWDGEAADLREAGRDTIFIILLAVLIIYMVLAAQFESLKAPFVIMFTLPLAIFGALGSLWLLAWIDHLGLPFLPRIPAMGINLFSQIGMILLIGIVTKNGILLVEFANQQMAKGNGPVRAIMSAGKVRFRPILMTAFSTIVGILPVAIGFGAGAESRRPLGVAAVGGIAMGTFLTTFIIPAVYILVHWKRARKGRSNRELASRAALVLLALLIAGGKLADASDKFEKFLIPEGPVELDQGTMPKYAREAQVADTNWWELFNDEELNQLIELALANNYELEKAVANVEEARALMRQDRAAFFPSLSMGFAYDRSRTSGSSSGFSSGRRTDRYEVPFDLEYELDVFGRLRQQVKAGKSLTRASQADRQAIMLTLKADVVRSYVLLREVDKEMEIINETIKLREYAVEVVGQRVKGGVTSELDFNRAKSELAIVRTERIDIQRRRRVIKNSLAVLCGQVPHEFTIAEKALDIPVPQLPVSLSLAVLLRRPDLVREENLLAAAGEDVGVAKKELLPRLTFGARAGYQSSRSSDLTDWDSRFWSIGPKISVPLFTGGELKAGVDEAEAVYRQNLANYQQAVLSAAEEVQTSLDNLNLRKLQAESHNEVLQSSRATAKLSIERYREGLVTFLEVIDSERTRLDAELKAVNIAGERLIATVGLIKSLGGYWITGDSEGAAPRKLKKMDIIRTEL